MASGILLAARVTLPDGLDASDYDRKVVMKGLRQAAAAIRSQSRQLLNRRGAASKEGDFPARQTGAMVRAVKVHAAKKRDKFWTRVQIDSIKDAPFWYPAPLMYGSKRGLKPRRDAVWQAGQQLESRTTATVEGALRRALKGWF